MNENLVFSRYKVLKVEKNDKNIKNTPQWNLELSKKVAILAGFKEAEVMEMSH